ncbi:MAG: MFS transporter [Candidatus Thermoplasmatota archaeon]
MNEKKKILSTVSMYHALTDGSVSVIPLLFPIFKQLFQLSYTEVGIITGGGLCITLIFQLIIGEYGDGQNTGVLLSFGILCTAISLLLLSTSRDFFTLVFFIFVLRFSTSFFHPLGVGWISRTFKKEGLDWAMGIQSGSADFGSFLAVLSTLYLTDVFQNWGAPLYIWAGGCFCGLIIGLLAIKDLQQHALRAPRQKNRTRGKKQTIREAFQVFKQIKLLAPGFMISGAAWGVTITYLPLLLTEKTTLSLPIIGMSVAVWIGVGSITSLCYGKIRNRINRKKLIILAYFILGGMSILITLSTQYFLIISAMILLGISVFLTYPALFSFVSEVTHESVEGRTFGIIFTFQTGGGTLLIFISGFLADFYGITFPFVLIGCLSLFFATVLLLYRRTTYVHHQITNKT